MALHKKSTVCDKKSPKELRWILTGLIYNTLNMINIPKRLQKVPIMNCCLRAYRQQIAGKITKCAVLKLLTFLRYPARCTLSAM